MELFFQKNFFEALKKAVPASVSLADAIADILGISIDSAYRRIRCNSVLSLDETLAIIKHFNLPISALGLTAPNMVSFYVNELRNKKKDFEDYLNGVREDVKKVSEFPGSHITYAAEDVPVFYHFFSKGLSYFKMFYWMKAIQNVDDLEFNKYTPDMFGDFYEQTGHKIYSCYAQCPTTEIWTDETIQSTLSQIKFFWDAGFIEKKEYALELCKELTQLIELIKIQSENSCKYFNPNSPTHKQFDFYISDLMIGTNSVLVKLDQNRVSYISYNTFGSIKTTSPFFASQTESWLDNLVSKSTLVSGVGEKQRNQFFKKVFGKINQLIEHIEND